MHAVQPQKNWMLGAGVGADVGSDAVTELGSGVGLQRSGLHAGPHGPFGNSSATCLHAAVGLKLPCMYEIRSPHV